MVELGEKLKKCNVWLLFNYAILASICIFSSLQLIIWIQVLNQIASKALYFVEDKLIAAVLQVIAVYQGGQFWYSMQIIFLKILQNLLLTYIDIISQYTFIRRKSESYKDIVNTVLLKLFWNIYNICMFVYIYIHIYKHTYMHIYIH